MANNRQRHIPTRPEKQEEKLFVFGYSCKIFRDDEKAAFIDQGKHLIPWMGDDSVMIDRYDVRGYLHDLKPYEARNESTYNEILSEEEKQMETLCDEERYLALRTDLTEEQMYQEEELKRLRAAVAGDGAYHEIGFTYDNAQMKNDDKDPNVMKEELDDEPFKIPSDLEIPKGMLLPSNMKIHAIIEKTATFVSRQGGQMEIIIKMKQSNNPQFAFMQMENPLYPYYKHLVKEIKAGKYKPIETKKSVRETDEEDEDEHYLHPSLMSGKPEFIPKFTVPSINFRRTDDDSYSMLVKNLKQRIIDDARSSSPSSQAEQDNSNAGSPLTADDSSSHPHAYDSDGGDGKNWQPRPPGEERMIRDEDGRSMKATGSDDSDSSLTDSDDGRKCGKVVAPPLNIKPIVDKMAEYVAKNGGDFEYVVKSKKDRRFDFLHSWHEHHPYYLMKKNEVLDQIKPTSVRTTSEVPNPAENYDIDNSAIDSDRNYALSEDMTFSMNGSGRVSVLHDNYMFPYGDVNAVSLTGYEIAESFIDSPQVSSEFKLEAVDEMSQGSGNAEFKIDYEKPQKEGKPVKSAAKVMKGPISFSLKPKESDTSNLELTKRTLLLDDSDGEELPDGEQKVKVDNEARKRVKDDIYSALSNAKDFSYFPCEDRSKKLSAEELDARHAEERIKDKLAAAARDRIAQQKRGKQLQLERKRRAALFLNKLKTNPQAQVPECSDSVTRSSDLEKITTEVIFGPCENLEVEEYGNFNISPTISEITSPRNGTFFDLIKHAASGLPEPVNNIVGNSKWSSSSSSSSSEDSSGEHCSRSPPRELSPSSMKRRRLKMNLGQRKKKKKHSSSRSDSRRERKKHSTKSRVRSRSRTRHKSHKHSKSRSHKHKRSRSRTHSKRTKTLPAAYTVQKRSRSRSPRHHKPGSRSSPSLWIRR